MEFLSFGYTIILFWIAFTLFIVAVLFELWSRILKAMRQKHTQPHSNRIDKALLYFRHHKSKKITNNKWQKITEVSHATASRDLGHLVELGILKRLGKGRGVYYKFTKQKNN